MSIFDQFLDAIGEENPATESATATENIATEGAATEDNTATATEPAAEEPKTEEATVTDENKGEADVASVEGEAAPATESEAEEVERLLNAPDEEATESDITIDPNEFLTEGLESAIFLDVLKETMDKSEMTKFLQDNKTELELYGLVNMDAIGKESYDEADGESEPATEQRNIVRLNRMAQISREEARIAIGLAKKNNDPLYKYYHKYAVLKRKFRDKIYAKYNNRAKGLARQAVMNSRHKASAMNNNTGTTIVNKIDDRIKQLDSNGRNREAVKNPSK